MNGKNPWQDALELSEENFAQQDSVRQAKERMFYSIMKDLAPNNEEPEISFFESEQLVETLAEKKGKKGTVVSFPYYRVAIGIAAVMGLVIFAKANISMEPAIPNATFYPPLEERDEPPLLSQNTPYRTVATNNVFYLGYAQSEHPQGSIDVLVHSRSGEVDWNSLSAIDLDEDSVTPISIDKASNVISLPTTESEIIFEVKDEHGNTMECIIPANL